MSIEQPEGAFTPTLEEIENLIIDTVLLGQVSTHEIRRSVEELLMNIEAQQ